MLTSKLTWFTAQLANWIAGSLIFKGINLAMDWIVKLSRGSFIVGLFTRDDAPQKASLEKSYVVRLWDKLLNSIPKPLTLPARWPEAASTLFSGSTLIRTTTDRMDTPLPPPVPNTGAGMMLAWGAYALPVWALLAVVIAIPVLPTMVLAGILLVIFIFTLLSRRFVLDGTAVFLLFFIIISLVAGGLSIAPASSMRVVMLTSVIMVSALSLVACCKSRDSVDMFILGFIGAATIAGTVGAYQIFFGLSTRQWLDLVMFTDIGGRFHSTFENPNVYGTYLLIAIPITAACIVYVKNRILKLCTAGITGMLLINLIATYSRGCYLALAVSAVVFVLIIKKQLVAFLVPAILALPFILPTTVVNRIFSIFDPEETSTIFRVHIWRGTLRMLGDFWPIGLGQGEEAFNRVYPYYSLAAIFTPHSHNMFLQIFVETGIVGLLVFIGVLACFFRAQVNFLRRVKEFRLRFMSAAMIAAAVGFLFQGMFDYAFYNYRVMMVFFLFIGLGIAFTRVNDPTKAYEKNAPKSKWVTGYHD